jgi:hypothetical protein
MTSNECLKHFSPEISEEIKKYATDEAFLFSRYIFTRREGKKQYGYCTHCHTEFETVKLKHNAGAECPNCKSSCKVKSSAMGHKYLIDEVYFTYYEKSLIDHQVMVAKGIYASRSYRGDYHNVKTTYSIESIYVLKMGDCTMLKPTYYRKDYYGKYRLRSMFSYWSGKSYIDKVCYSQKSIEETIKGTPFQYSMWKEYSSGDMVEYFDLYSKYPCIEYLTKEGFEEVVEDKLYGRPTYSAINWNGKTIFKILKVNKSQLKEIKQSKIKFDCLLLKLFQLSAKDKSNLPVPTLQTISRSYGFYIDNLRAILKYTSLRKIDKYIDVQLKKSQKFLYTKNGILSTWKDYILDCIKLEMDLSSDNILFPKNLYTAHQNTIKQIKVKADAMLDKKIKERAVTLQNYYFEFNDLVIRAANSSQELIEESKSLHHCVASNYTNPYADGKTNIFFIRKTTEPDKPYFTLELKKGQIVQCRGKHNRSQTNDVTEFIKAFEEAKLKDKRSKIKIPA